MNYRHTIASHERPDVSPQGEHVAELLAVFQRVCDNLNLEVGDQSLARTIAKSIIEAGLAGEDDPERLFEHAMQVARTS